jgi:hypothetical protein
MPAWWPRGYTYFLAIPVLGAYRAPARYTAIASLGLALLAGAGLDRLVSRRRFMLGFVLATAGVIAALAWSSRWIPVPGGAFPGIPSVPRAAEHWLLAAGTSALALMLILLWRAGRLPAAILIIATLIELTALYYTGPIQWGRPLPLPQGSPVLTFLANDPSAVRVGGDLENYPLLAGKATATPYLGFSLSEPNATLAWMTGPNSVGRMTLGAWNSLSRLGISHIAVKAETRDQPEVMTTVWRGTDPLLSRLLNAPSYQPWQIVRPPGLVTPARVAIRLEPAVFKDVLHPTAYFTGMIPADGAWVPQADLSSYPKLTASSARVVRWGGHSGEVEHDGSCLLVLTRTYYPGWTYRLDGGPARPVISVDGGLQGIPIPGAGTTRVTVAYRPIGITAAVAMSLAGLGAVAAVGVLSIRNARRASRISA